MLNYILFIYIIGIYVSNNKNFYFKTLDLGLSINLIFFRLADMYG